MMAVAEIAISEGKSAGETQAGSSSGTSTGKHISLKVMSFSFMLALGSVVLLPVAQAEIIGDKNAPGNQRPTVLNSANGTPTVNIQTPSKGGVSMNQYQKFDVDKKGAILNNSRGNTQTQLGGWVQGNPFLATGSARVIVNQVNSANPSYLNGYIEVAGQKAEVIIANPAGLSINGGGFINASGVTLTTGTPVVSGAGVDAFRVRGGSITVGKDGLDTSGADYTRLISQALQLKGGIWAKDLKATMGTNDVAADGKVTVTEANKGQPVQWGIDVAELGGMYAGKITLISTDKGVGVNNAGQMFASAGGVSIDANGLLSNSGSVVADNKDDKTQAAQISIKSQTVNNSGTLSANDTQTIQSASLNNSGLIHTADELVLQQQGLLQNSGNLKAARLDLTANQLHNEQGHITQTGSQGLDVQAKHISNSDGSVLGNKPQESGTTGGTSTGSGGQNPGTGTITTPPSTSTGGGDIAVDTVTPSKTFATGSIKVVEDLLSSGGSVTANGDVNIVAEQGFSNTNKANVQAKSLTVNKGDFSNALGKATLENLNAKVNNFDNSRGELTVLSTATHIQAAQDFSNQAGKLSTTGTLKVTAGSINNQAGSIEVANAVSLSSQTDLNNQAGKILANQDIVVTAASIDNSSGNISSNQGDISVESTSSINNKQGVLQADGRVGLDSSGLNNQQGKVLADAVSINSGSATLNNDQGQIASVNNIQIRSGALSNQKGQIQANKAIDVDTAGHKVSNQQGKMVAGSQLSINSGLLNNNDGLLQAQTDLNVNSHGQSIHNAQTQAFDSNKPQGMVAENINLQSGDISGAGNIMVAQDSLNIVAGDITTPNGMVYAKNKANITANSLDVSHGSLQAGDTVDLGLQAALNNDGGHILANSIKIQAQNVSNQNNLTDKGGIEANHINLNSATLDNRGGRVVSMEALPLQVGSHLQNQGGLISSNKALSIQGKPDLIIDNGSGSISAVENLSLVSQQLLSSGSVVTNKELSIKADGVRNSGELSAAGKQAIHSQSLHNSGSIASNAQLSIAVTDLDNQKGNISADHLQITAKQLQNQEGTIAQTGLAGLALEAGVLSNNQGVIGYHPEDQSAQSAQPNTGAGAGHATTGNTTKPPVTGSGNNTSLGNQTTNPVNPSTPSTGSSVPNGFIKVAGNLNNDKGGIYANAGIDLDVSNGLINKGALQLGDLSVKGAQFINDGGKLSADALTIATQTASNQAGKISVQKDFSLNSTGFNNQAGEVAVNGNAHITTGQLSNQSGSIEAAGSQSLQVQDLDNRKGSIVANQALDIQAQGQVLNQAGVLGSAQGGLNIVTAGILDNSAGQVSAANNVSVTVGSLLNKQGTVASSKTLNLHSAQDINNHGGSLTADEHAQITAQNLDNTSGQIGAVTGDVSLNLSGDLSNGQDAGVLDANNQVVKGTIAAAAGKAKVQAKNIGNDRGVIYAKNTDIQAQDISNQSGEISSADKLNINALSLNNSAGTVFANSQADIKLAGMLNNQGGTVASLNQLNLYSAGLNNSTGSIYSTAQGVSIQSTGLLDNTDGYIGAKEQLTIQAQSIHNQRVDQTAKQAILTGKGINLDVTGVLSNSGDIYSQADANINSTSLNNDHGNLSADGKLAVDVLGNVSNKQGGITANGDVALAAFDLDNTAGQIGSSNGNVGLNLSGDLNNNTDTSVKDAAGKTIKSTIAAANGQIDINTRNASNQGGVIYAQNARLQAQDVNNHSGEISAANNVSIGASSVDNRLGTVFAQDELTVTVQNGLNNQAGTVAAKGKVSVQAGSVNNRTGSLYSQKNALDLKSQGVVNNTDGYLAADTDLLIAAKALDNSRTNKNTQQAIVTANNVTLNLTDSVRNSGDVYAKNNAVVTAQTLNNDAGNLSAGHTVDIKAQNNISNHAGNVTANNHVSIVGADLNNTSGQIGSSNGNVTLALSGDLLNNTDAAVVDKNNHAIKGTVAAANGVADIKASNVSNTGGVIHAQDTRINTGKLSNHQGEISAKRDILLTADSLDSQAGTIFAENTLTAAVKNALSNTQGSHLGGKGAVNIQAGSVDNSGGNLYSVNNVLGLHSSGAINNADGYVAAAKDLNLSAASLSNQRLDASKKQAIITADNVILDITGAMQNSGDVYAKGNADVNAQTLNNDKGNLSAEKTLAVAVKTDLSNKEGSLTAGGNATITGRNLDNTAGQIGSQTGNLTLKLKGVLSNDAGSKKGTIAAAQGVSDIRASSISNQGGAIYAHTTNISTGSINNQKGEISAIDDVNISASSLDNKSGTVFAQNELGMVLSGAIDFNQAGTIGASNAVSLQAASVNNASGNVYSVNQSLALHSKGTVNNNDGYIGAKTNLSLTASSLDNQRLDAIKKQANIVADSINLVVAGHVRNSGDIYAHSLNMLKAGTLNNRDGNVAAADALNVTVGGDINNHAGKLNAGKDITLTAQNLDNTSGTIGSTDGNATINISKQFTNGTDVNSKDASGNALVGTVAVSQGKLDFNAGAINNKDGIVYAKQAVITAKTGNIDNQDGVIQSAESLKISSAKDVNNAGGSINAKTTLNLKAQNIDNAAGQISSDSHNHITAATLTNSNAGQIGTVKGNLTLDISGQLHNQSKGVIAATQGTATINGQDIHNDDATISADALTLTAKNSITNQNQATVYANSVNLSSVTLNNAQATVWSNHGLDIITKTLTQSGGKIQSQDDISIKADSLSQSNSMLVAKQGNMNLNIRGDLSNKGNGNGKDITESGLILAGKDLNVTANNVSNTQGNVIAAHIDLNANNSVNNQKGQIAASNTLAITAKTLTQSDGATMSAMDGLNLQISTVLDNNASTIVSNNGLDIDAQTLINDSGKIIANNSIADISVAGRLDNRNNAVIQADTVLLNANDVHNNSQASINAIKNMQLSSKTGLDNQGGQLVSQGGMTLNLNGKALNNQAGLVSSQQALNVNASSINNQAGSIETAGALGLISAGQLNNADGRVVGNGITINTQSVNNQGGNVISNAGLSIQNSVDFNNNKGYVYANTGIGITAKNITNTEGTIKSLGKIDLQAANQLDNSKGWIGSNADVTLKANKVINNGTLDANNIAMGIQGNNVSVTTQNLDNIGGKIIATDKAALLVENQINNQKGSISSDGQIIMQKSDGTAMALVDNRDGSIVAKDNTIFKTKQVLNDGGELVFGDNLSLDIVGDYTQSGVLQAGNDANITIGGHLTNEGTLEAQNNLNLKANDLTNMDDAKIVAGQNTNIEVKNTLNNYGLIDGTNTTIHTSKLNNEGEKARIYGTHLAIEADEINNKASDRNGDGVLGAGTIAARDRLDIGAKTILNEEDALIYSDGSVHIGGKLDANKHATGMANSIINSSATIESGTDMDIAANTLVNKDTHVKLGTDWVLLSQSEHVREVFGLGYTHQPHENSVDTSRWYSEDELWSPGYEEFYTGSPWTGNYQKVQRPTDYKNEDGNIRFKVWANQAIYLEVKQANGSWESYSHWLMRSGKKTVEQQNVVDAKPGKIIAGGNMNISGNKWTNSDSQIIAGKAITANIVGGIENTSTVTPKQRITFVGDSSTKAVDNGAEEKFAGQTNCWDGSTSFFCLSQVESAIQQGMKGDAYQDEWVERGAGGKLEGIKDPRFADNDKVYLSLAEQMAKDGGYKDFWSGSLRPMNNGNSPERTVLVAVDKSSNYDGLHTYIRDDSGVQVRYKRENYNNVTIVDGDNSVSNSVYQEYVNINKSSVNTNQTKVGSGGAGTSGTAGKVGGESAVTTGSASTSVDAAKTTTNLNGKAASKSINTVMINQQNSEVSDSNQTGNKQVTSNTGASVNTVSSGQNAANINVGAALVNGVQVSSNATDANGADVAVNSDVSGQASAHGGGQTTVTGNQNIDSVAKNSQGSGGSQAGRNTDIQATNNQLTNNQTLDQTTQAQVDNAAQDNVRVRTVFNAATVPTQSMYTVDPNSVGHLVETDPNFTRYNKWLSSDYMLGALNLDPAKMQKRLGDGYYEQKLVNQQINQLTGRAYLNGYRNYEDQYKALMSNGLTVAADLNLTPGVALTQEQLARLTSDIVWLVSQTVTLADGSTQTVLVPQVYVRVQPGDIDGSGALISADVVNLNIAGNLENNGTIAGRKAAIITADNIDMLNGKVVGGTVALDAKNNINLMGSQVVATDNAYLTAQNIHLESTTGTYSSQIENGTVLDRVAGVYITGTGADKGALVLAAKENISLAGTELINASNGITQLSAGKDLTIGSLTTHQNMDVIQSKDAYNKNRSTQEIGSNIQTKGDVILTSGNDVNIRGSNISSQLGVVDIAAKNDINIETSQNTQFSENYFHTKKKGAFRSSESVGHGVANVVTNNASSVDGVMVNLNAGNDVNIVGSNVISDQLTQIQAGNNVNIKGAEDTFSQQSESWSKSSGISGGNMGLDIGKTREKTTQTVDSSTHVGSMVGSLEGNANIVAGKQYNQIGSSVNSPQGDVNVVAQSINIGASKSVSDTYYKHEYEKSGLTVALQSSLISVGTGLKGAMDSGKQGGEVENGRVKAMAAANASWGAYAAGKDFKDVGDWLTNTGGDPKTSGLRVSLTYGEQKNVSTTTTHSETNTASDIRAGGKVNLVATGADKDSNINIRGSNVAGKQGTNLFADNKVNITSSQDIYQEHSENRSAGWNAGVSVGYENGQAALGVTAGGNYGKGHGKGDSLNHNNSHVGDANSQTNIISGGATNIAGGQILGKGISLSAEELNIASLQNTSKYDGKQENVSAQVTVGYGASASGEYSKTKVKSDYASVQEQSGIIAGDDGYQIDVKGNTDLKGAIITSTRVAEENGKNKLSTGSITLTDIENHAEFEASGFSIGASYKPGDSVKKESNTDSNNKPGASQSIGYATEEGKDASITSAGVNTKNIVITDAEAQKQLTGQSLEQAKDQAYLAINSDKLDQSTGFIENNFDKDKIQKQIDLQVAISKDFSQNVQKAGQELNTWQDSLEKENKEIKKELADGDITDERRVELNNKLNKNNNNIESIDDYKMALNTIGMALSAPTDSIGGIAAAAASPKIAYEIGQYFKNQEEINKLTGVNNGELTAGQKMAHVAAHAVLGAAVAAIGGNDALTAGLAAGGAEAAVPVISNWLYQTDDPEKLTAEQKSTLTAIAGLIGTGVGLSTGGSVTDVASGSQLAQNAVINNALNDKRMQHYADKLRKCSSKIECEKIIRDMENEDRNNRIKLMLVCSKNPQSNGCQGEIGKAIIGDDYIYTSADDEIDFFGKLGLKEEVVCGDNKICQNAITEQDYRNQKDAKYASTVIIPKQAKEIRNSQLGRVINLSNLSDSEVVELKSYLVAAAAGVSIKVSAKVLTVIKSNSSAISKEMSALDGEMAGENKPQKIDSKNYNNNPYLTEGYDKNKIIKSKQSLEILIKEHELKIQEFKENPMKFDDGRMQNATKEIRQKMIDGRINALEKQVKKQKINLNYAIEALELLKGAQK